MFQRTIIVEPLKYEYNSRDEVIRDVGEKCSSNYSKQSREKYNFMGEVILDVRQKCSSNYNKQCINNLEGNSGVM